MIKQLTLSALGDELAQAKTKKKEFLNQIERIVPWSEWLTIITPHYYKGAQGNRPYDTELMLRLYLLQHSHIPALHRRSKCFFRSLETKRAVSKIFVSAFNDFAFAKFKFPAIKNAFVLSHFL